MTGENWKDELSELIKIGWLSESGEAQLGIKSHKSHNLLGQKNQTVGTRPNYEFQCGRLTGS